VVADTFVVVVVDTFVDTSAVVDTWRELFLDMVVIERKDFEGCRGKQTSSLCYVMLCYIYITFDKSIF
jgi:hypothetical protein